MNKTKEDEKEKYISFCWIYYINTKKKLIIYIIKDMDWKGCVGKTG